MVVAFWASLVLVSGCSPPAPGEPTTAEKVGYFIGSVIGARLAGALYGAFLSMARASALARLSMGCVRGV